MDVLDEALKILEDAGPEYSGGLINHGPMAAQAMIEMGHDGAVLPWVDYYRRRLETIRGDFNPVPSDRWREALGKADLYGNWTALFTHELAEETWPSILKTWVPRLAPGMSGAAGHGLIRTSHAVRALEKADTAPRRNELARGLAYWASRYQKLSSEKEPDRSAMTPLEALQHIPILPEEKKVRFGLTGEKLKALDSFPPFRAAVNFLDVSAEYILVSELLSAFTAVYRANARSIKTVNIFVHTVTAPRGVRSLLPYLDPGSRQEILRSVWQVCAGLYAVLGNRSLTPDGMPRRLESPANIAERAVRTGDEHAIKFTEACLHEYSIHPDLTYIEAATDAVERLLEISRLK
ncbi:MAG: questin oxidase family protein [Syntrophales bacterium]